MAIWALGINHKTAPVAVRERVSFDPATMPEALAQVCQLNNISEAVILSTCNRTEIYCAAEENLAPEALAAWLEHYHQLEANALTSSFYALDDEKAVQHAMRVASGLDSLILGEPQIFGQMKDAYANAQQAGTVGTQLGRLFRQTFSVAKKVRTDTAIGENPVSVAFAAVRMAQRIFADVKNSHALLIGAGETIELVARHLNQAGIAKMTVANRTLARAQNLAKEFGGEAILLEDISQALSKADIVISSTASPLPIVGKGMVERALKTRRHQPMFMVDIAVPRDIEEEVGELADIYLYTVDDLRSIIDENVRTRELAAKQAESMISTGVEHFMRDLKVLDAVETVTDLRDHVQQQSNEQLQKALKQLELGHDPEEVLRHFAHNLTNKLLHAPTVALRQASGEGNLDALSWARTFFQLPEKRPFETKH